MDILAEPIEQTLTDDGEIQAGALFISVKNTGDQVANVNGEALPPGQAKSYPFVGKGYKAIPYEASGTEILVMTII